MSISSSTTLTTNTNQALLESKSGISTPSHNGMRARDPTMDLDFGLDLKKFGLDEAPSNTAINHNTNNKEANINVCSLLYDPPVSGKIQLTKLIQHKLVC